MRIAILSLLIGGMITSASAAPNYFPIKEKTADGGISQFYATWYSKALSRMKEPELPKLAENQKLRVYRLTVLPTWTNSITVRIQLTGTNYIVWSRRLDGEGGFDPGKLVETNEVKLSASDSRKFDSLIASVRFFDMPTDETMLGGADGTEWVLEGVSNGRYHVVQRSDARDYETEKRGLKDFVKLANFMLDKSGLAKKDTGDL